MEHVTLNNHDYILWRLPSYNDPTQAELVDSQTGEVIRVERNEVDRLPRRARDLPIEPAAVPFPSRPQSFVSELQQRRLEYLRDAQAKKRTDKAPRRRDPGAPKPRAKRATKTQQLMNQLLQQRLAELSSDGGLSPMQLEVLKKMSGT
jgi:hypothetical protein